MTVDSRRYYNDQITRSVRQADAILVPSEATKADLVALLNVPAEKVTTHMLGVHEMFHPVSPEAVAAVRARYHLPDDYLLFVGTFEPRKNLPGLFAAYALLREELPDVPPLVLVGRKGWLMDEINAAVEQHRLHDALRWIEDAPHTDLPALYAGARVLAVPSHYEGFGLTVVEAMACGTPPVISNRASLPEVAGDAALRSTGRPGGLAMCALLTDDALHAESARGLAGPHHLTLAAAGRVSVAAL